MFEHSVKVPRHYKAAANILKKVCTEGGSIKTLIYDAKYRHFNVNSLYALVTTAVRNARALTSLFNDIELLEREPRLDQWLARILAIEILMGKKSLPGNSKPEQTLLSYKEQIEYFPTKHPELFDFKGPCRPRYVRVNTIKMSIEEFIIRFKREGYRFIPCTKGSYDDFLDQVRNIEEGDFLQDYHVKCMFAFHTSSKFHDHDLRLDGRILLQDKASALAVELLAPEPGAAILDMCAAPGMKTTQAAAYVNNSSTMYAIEINPARHEVLDTLVKLAGANRVNVILGDVFEVDKHSMSDVEYVLLDPSCSGSGMDYNLGDYTKEEEEWKLEKLTALQEKLLRYAMTSFPRAKRIVYSTCSLLPEENERVIMNVLNNSRRKWQVQCAKSLLHGQWKNFGQGKPGSIPRKCLYAKPDSDLTKGFFLAVLERNSDDLSKGISSLNREYGLQIDRERNAIKGAEEVKETKERIQAAKFGNQEICKQNENSEYHNEGDEPNEESKKKKKKTEYNEAECTYSNDDNVSLKINRKMKVYGESLDNITNDLSGLVVEEEIPKKRKKLTDPMQNKQIELNTSREKVSKKKKRRTDMGENEISEATQLGSTSESRNSKKKKHKKHEYCNEEDEAKPESKKQIKDQDKLKFASSDHEIVLTKSNHKIKSNSLNNITDDLNGLVMVEDIPKKRKKLNDPVHDESKTSHADFSANDMEYDEKVSKKKKRRKDKDVNIELEETQEISKSESKISKKDKHKTNDVDLSEGKKKKRREHMDINEETEETHLRSKSESGKRKKKKHKKDEMDVPEELCIEDA